MLGELLKYEIIRRTPGAFLPVNVGYLGEEKEFSITIKFGKKNRGPGDCVIWKWVANIRNSNRSGEKEITSPSLYFLRRVRYWVCRV